MNWRLYMRAIFQAQSEEHQGEEYHSAAVVSQREVSLSIRVTTKASEHSVALEEIQERLAIEEAEYNDDPGIVTVIVKLDDEEIMTIDTANEDILSLDEKVGSSNTPTKGNFTIELVEDPDEQ